MEKLMLKYEKTFSDTGRRKKIQAGLNNTIRKNRKNSQDNKLFTDHRFLLQTLYIKKCLSALLECSFGQYLFFI